VSKSPYSAAITTPPAIMPIIPLATLVGTAPPFEDDVELGLELPVAALASLVDPPVLLAIELPPPSASVVTCLEMKSAKYQ
jgi:hypothetical protein